MYLLTVLYYEKDEICKHANGVDAKELRRKRAEVLRPCNGGDSTSQEKLHEAEHEHKRTKRPADYREEERTRILENRGMNGLRSP